MDAVVDRFVVGPKHEKAIKAGIAATLLVGDGLMQVQVLKGASKAEAERFYKACAAPRTISSTAASSPSTSCSTIRRAPAAPAAASASTRSPIRNCWCPTRSAASSAAASCKEAYKYNPDTWDGRIMYSLSKALRFSLETPWEKLPETVRNTILYGLEARKFAPSRRPKPR